MEPSQTSRRTFLKTAGTAVVFAVPSLSLATKPEPRTAMKITRAGTQPSEKASPENFTGSVRVDPLFETEAPARSRGSTVTFEPGSRTAWHTHPLGQTLIITSGLGLVQRWDGPVEEVRTGDVVWFPPGMKHWHGASPTTAMSHIAVVEVLDGKSSDWMEKVSDEQYSSPPKG
jgi:quercetin dioxygenase-like cupin family protein